MRATAPSIKLAADTSLPQRDLLLDEGEVARRLARCLGAGGPLAIDACARVRAKYRFGQSLRVLHRVRVGSSAYAVAARAFHNGRSEQAYERALGEAVACAPLRPVIHDAELDTVFWTFPNDRKLSGLQSLSDIPAQLARASLPGWTRSRVVAYAPEKCATAQCLDDRLNLLAYAKLYAGPEGQSVANTYQSLRQNLPTQAGVGLPRVISYAAAHRLLLLEPAAGERIADLKGSDLLRGYERLGSALASLHSLPVPKGLPRFKRLDPARIRSAARVIGTARPDVRNEAARLAADLMARWEPPAEALVCLHGDIHPKNGILRGDRLTLIDLDQAGVGRPAADLGSLLAGLTYNRLCGLIPRDVERELGESFLSGYGRARGLPREVSLNWHTAAALLAERALRAVNRIRPEGLGCLHELLAEARHVLRSGGTG